VKAGPKLKEVVVIIVLLNEVIRLLVKDDRPYIVVREILGSSEANGEFLRRNLFATLNLS